MMGMSEGARALGKYLWILRHGKAASDAPWGGGDRERPLAARGRRDASALGKALATGEGPFAVDGAVSPQVVVCSAAVRTRQTADLLIDASGMRLPLGQWRSLYEADVDTALEDVRFIDSGRGERAGGRPQPDHVPTGVRTAGRDGRRRRSALELAAAAGRLPPMGSRRAHWPCSIFPSTTGARSERAPPSSGSVHPALLRRAPKLRWPAWDVRGRRHHPANLPFTNRSTRK